MEGNCGPCLKMEKIKRSRERLLKKKIRKRIIINDLLDGCMESVNVAILYIAKGGSIHCEGNEQMDGCTMLRNLNCIIDTLKSLKKDVIIEIE